MFSGLLIWNETMHAKNTWSMSSLLHLWLLCNCWLATRMRKRTEKHHRHTLRYKQTIYWTLIKLSHILPRVTCRYRRKGCLPQNDLLAVLSNHAYKNVLCWNRVYTKCADCNDCYKMCSFFHGLYKPWNIFPTKISRSTVALIHVYMLIYSWKENEHT